MITKAINYAHHCACVFAAILILPAFYACWAFLRWRGEDVP